jgi:hypothetical protein
MAKKGRPPKDKFDDLDEEFRAFVLGSDPNLVKQRLAEVVLEHQRLVEARKNDGDLQEKKWAFEEADAVYREGKKLNKLRIEFAREILVARGAIE